MVDNNMNCNLLDACFWLSEPSHVQNLFFIILGVLSFILAVWKIYISNKSAKADYDQAKLSTHSYLIEITEDIRTKLQSEDTNKILLSLRVLKKINQQFQSEYLTVFEILNEHINNRHNSEHNHKEAYEQEAISQILKENKKLQKQPWVFKNVDLRRFKLTDVKFKNAKFEGCLINNNTFSNSDFKKCIFENINFENLIINRIFFDNSKFTKCNFNKSKFERASLHYSKFYECSFVETEIRISNSYFEKCDMQKIIVNDSKNPHHICFTRFFECNLKHSKFNNVYFKIVEFEECNLSSAEFKDISVQCSDGLVHFIKIQANKKFLDQFDEKKYKNKDGKYSFLHIKKHLFNMNKKNN
jgi:uncharacterized protein YjbI with pentapeptide repeats